MKGSLKDSITDTAMYLFEREGMLRYEAAQLSERIEKAWFEGRDTKTLKSLHFSVLREIESMRQAQEINRKRAQIEASIRRKETLYMKT